MQDKGFTLIELILVLLLLSVIALISIPIVNGIIKDSKEKAYGEQINIIKTAATTYMSKNPAELPAEDEFDNACISILDLQKAGMLENKDIVNPLHSESCEDTSSNSQCKNRYFKGVIRINWDSENNKYKYIYDDSADKCNNGDVNSNEPNNDLVELPTEH